jgi:serine/threonine protein kinase
MATEDPRERAEQRTLLLPRRWRALAVLHAERCYHRDVAPDNIQLLYDRGAAPSYLEQAPRPLLLDFGAARGVIGDATQNLTAIL